ncbi:MAG: TIGR02530 family flagellar biosynthesis protein [Bacteriovoracaceae bacterium]
MTNGNINNILIPNVNRANLKEQVTNDKKSVENPDEFKSLLKEQLSGIEKQEQGIKLSVHAAKRLQERSMDVDAPELKKLKEGMEKLEKKGGQDSLLVTNKGAYIVDIPNRTIVTAIDKESLTENVFTKIDSTLILT